MIIFGLRATGIDNLDSRRTIHSKKLFKSRERAVAEISVFREKCIHDDGGVVGMGSLDPKEKIDIQIVEWELEE